MAIKFEMAFTKIIPDLLCASILQTMAKVSVPMYVNTFYHESSDEEERLEKRGSARNKSSRMTTLRTDNSLKDIGRSEYKDVHAFADERKKAILKKLGVGLKKQINQK